MTCQNTSKHIHVKDLDQIRSIVVRGNNWIGDAIMSVPALRELRRIFPRAEIVLLTRQWAEGIFLESELVDGVISIGSGGSQLKEKLRQADILKQESFDLAVVFPNSFESALIPFLARVPIRIGYNKDLRGLLLTEPVPVPQWKKHRHEVFYYLNLVAEIEKRMTGICGTMETEPDLRIEISEERKAGARRRLKDAGVDIEKRTIAFGVGSENSSAKRWGAERYASLCDRLRCDLRANVILIGSQKDKEVAERVLELCGSKPVDLTGTTDISEAAAILSVADLLVSNDMGLAHLAPALGTPTVVIFGPTDPVTTRPYSPLAKVVRHPVECSPCMLRDCPIDHRCMTRVTVDDVYNACLGSLQNASLESTAEN